MLQKKNSPENLKAVTLKLLDYCQASDWAGYDPYDGLNSRIFKKFSFLHNYLCRLIFIQGIKLSPVNLRPIFLVPKSQNPKGLALFSSAVMKLSNIGLIDDRQAAIPLLNRLIELRSPEKPYYCWGYNFDWQSRKFFLPKFEPNIICTTFSGNAFLDAYENYRDDSFLDIAISSGQFILKGLNITEDSAGICFSYTSFDHGQVHNANLLGAAFLARLYSLTNEREFLDYAISAVRFSVSRQRLDGSWRYGEDSTQKWIDSFHTGYNLVALKRFSEYGKVKDFEENIFNGFQFYKEKFFVKNGIAKYYPHHTYPIDIHSIAQSIITLVEFKELDGDNLNLAKRIFTWTLKEMQNQDGFFFYQKRRFYKYRIPYMRWSQAWMLLALSALLEHERSRSNHNGQQSKDD